MPSHPKSSFFPTLDSLVIITSLAFCLRLFAVLPSSFPLNDGGMFYTMVQDIQAAGFKLPMFTSFNSSLIPFAYPPLSLYVTALLNTLPLPLLSLFRFLPLVVSTLTVPAFFLLAKQVLKSKDVLLATLIFTLLPRSFEWQIMGGGITRSFGQLFSILTLAYSAKFFRQSSKTYFLISSLLLALTIISHLELTFFAVSSLIFLTLHFTPNFSGIKKVSAIILTSLILTSPWWMLILARHGLSPFLNAAASGLQAFDPTSYTLFLTLSSVTDEVFLPVLGTLTLLGLVITIQKRAWWLLSWFYLPIIIAPRNFLNFIVVPMSLVITHAVTSLLLPFFTHIIKPFSFRSLLALLIIPLYLLVSAIAFILPGNRYFDSVSSSEKTAIEWVKQYTPPNSRFLILSPQIFSSWGMDSLLEWFPALSQRISLATPQGTEWLPNHEFRLRKKLHQKIKGCYLQDPSCLESIFSSPTFRSLPIFQYILISRDNSLLSQACEVCLLTQQLQNSPRYKSVYQNPQVTIFSFSP